MEVKLADGRIIPVELHKIKIVQQAHLLNVEQRVEAMREAGFNTFLLQSRMYSWIC